LKNLARNLVICDLFLALETFEKEELLERFCVLIMDNN